MFYGLWSKLKQYQTTAGTILRSFSAQVLPSPSPSTSLYTQFRTSSHKFARALLLFFLLHLLLVLPAPGPGAETYRYLPGIPRIPTHTELTHHLATVCTEIVTVKHMVLFCLFKPCHIYHALVSGQNKAGPQKPQVCSSLFGFTYLVIIANFHYQVCHVLSSSCGFGLDL